MDKQSAQAIVARLAAFGTPPEHGVDEFTVGLDKLLRCIESEYFDTLLRLGLSSFKLVTGNYGAGKTHFLYSVRSLAFQHGYCVSYVGLSPTECPFDRLELVYKAVAAGLSSPGSTRAGIESVVRRWFTELHQQSDRATDLYGYLNSLPATESSSFSNALRGAFECLAADDAEGFAAVIQWLKGEDASKDVRQRFRISERVDKSTAFRILRSLAQWIHAVGYHGVVFLFDEAERGISISSARDRRMALDNLRQLVDECGNSRLPGVMVFYAVPDEESLLSGSGGVYEALRQRLRSSFSESSPLGVRIDLEKLELGPMQFLDQLGGRLSFLFESAYGIEIPAERRNKILRDLAQVAVSAFALDVSYRRLFVVAALEVLQQLRYNPGMHFSLKEAEKLLRVTARRLERSETNKP